jgi:hypothetical protein
MFVVQISLSIFTFLSFISQFCQSCKPPKYQSTPSHCAMCQYVECHLLLLHTIKMLHFVLFHNVTCYTISTVLHIHVNTSKLRNITCTVVATSVVLRSLECICTHTHTHIFCIFYEVKMIGIALCDSK